MCNSKLDDKIAQNGSVEDFKKYNRPKSECCSENIINVAQRAAEELSVSLNEVLRLGVF